MSIHLCRELFALSFRAARVVWEAKETPRAVEAAAPVDRKTLKEQTQAKFDALKKETSRNNAIAKLAMQNLGLKGEVKDLYKKGRECELADVEKEINKISKLLAEPGDTGLKGPKKPDPVCEKPTKTDVAAVLPPVVDISEGFTLFSRGEAPAAEPVVVTPPPAESAPVAEVGQCKPATADEIQGIFKALDAVRTERESRSIAIDPALGLQDFDPRGNPKGKGESIHYLNFKEPKDKTDFLNDWEKLKPSLNQDPTHYQDNIREGLQILLYGHGNNPGYRDRLETKSDGKPNFDVIDLHLTGEAQKEMADKVDELTKRLKGSDAAAAIKEFKNLLGKNAAILELIPRNRVSSIENPLVRALTGFFEAIGALVMFDGEKLEQMNHFLGRDMLLSKKQSYIDADGKSGVFKDMSLEKAKVNEDGTQLENAHYALKENAISLEQAAEKIVAAKTLAGEKISREDAQKIAEETGATQLGLITDKDGKYVSLQTKNETADANGELAKLGVLKYKLDLKNGPVDFFIDRYTLALPNPEEFTDFQKKGELPTKIGTLDLTHELYAAIVKGTLTAEQQTTLANALKDCAPLTVRIPIDRSKMVIGIIAFLVAINALKAGGGGGGEGPTPICTAAGCVVDPGAAEIVGGAI